MCGEKSIKQIPHTENFVQITFILLFYSNLIKILLTKIHWSISECNLINCITSRLETSTDIYFRIIYLVPLISPSFFKHLSLNSMLKLVNIWLIPSKYCGRKEFTEDNFSFSFSLLSVQSPSLFELFQAIFHYS